MENDKSFRKGIKPKKGQPLINLVGQRYGRLVVLEIDRKDNTKGYSPSNCRWVTAKKNCRNKRNNHFITIENETKTLSDWCDLYNISYSLVSSRLCRGWEPLKALTTPKLRERKNKDGN